MIKSNKPGKWCILIVVQDLVELQNVIFSLMDSKFFWKFEKYSSFDFGLNKDICIVNLSRGEAKNNSEGEAEAH